MGRTAWWKKRNSKSSAGGDNTVPPSAPDTSYSAHVKVERVPERVPSESSSSSEGSSPASRQLRKLRSDLSDSTKGDDEQSTSTKKNDESDETTKVMEEQKHVDGCSDHPEPGDVITERQSAEENGSNNNDVSTDKSSEAEVEENRSSLGDDGEQRKCVADEEEVPDIERTNTEDSGEGSVDSSAAETQGSSAQATIAVSVITNKTDNTDCTDDGILRDDEGNPVDLAEAEENMLRDDKGNIIDPKTLVTRESFLDLCEEYCEDLIHNIGADGAQNESEIDEDTYVRFTIEAIVSEMITHIEAHHDQSNVNNEICTEEDLTEPLKEGCNNEASAIDEADEDEDPSEAYDNVQPTLERGSRPKRNCNASGKNRSRQIRWGRASPQQGADDTVHIMFNNKLSTLDEEASCIIDEESAEETEDEQSNISQRSTRSEKFFKARWNYSLQVMKSEASTAQLIDARDEIDDMIRPKFADDRSVCSDEGTI